MHSMCYKIFHTIGMPFAQRYVLWLNIKH